jgi:hypothetical protein
MVIRGRGKERPGWQKGRGDIRYGEKQDRDPEGQENKWKYVYAWEVESYL